MWFLTKSAIAAVILVAAAYTVFLVDFGGESIASHVADIWGSEVVQHKVDLVRHGVREEIEDRLASAAEEATRERVKKTLGDQPEFDDADQTALRNILEEK